MAGRKKKWRQNNNGNGRGEGETWREGGRNKTNGARQGQKLSQSWVEIKSLTYTENHGCISPTLPPQNSSHTGIYHLSFLFSPPKMFRLSSLIAFVSVASLATLVACHPVEGGNGFDFLLQGEGATFDYLQGGGGASSSDFLPLIDESTETSQISGLDPTIPWAGSDMAFLNGATSTSPLDVTDSSSSSSNFLVAAVEEGCTGVDRYFFCCASFTSCVRTKTCINDEVPNCCTVDYGKTPDQFHDCNVLGTRVLGGSGLSDYLGDPGKGVGF